MTHDTQSFHVNAELYDLIYSWYRDDVDFYVTTARAAGGPVLEVACGTGRILLPALQAGADIDGLDLEPAMLAVLERKAQAAGLKPHVVQADMRDFTMPRRYALIIVPFRSFMHLHSTRDQLAALRCMREQLEPGGRLVLNLFYPAFAVIVAQDGQPWPERTFPHPETGDTVTLKSLTRYDRVGQTLKTEREMLLTKPNGHPVVQDRHDFTMRWTFLYEMELLLRNAGFARWDVAGGFDGRPLEKDTDEMVWTAWKD